MATYEDAKRNAKIDEIVAAAEGGDLCLDWKQLTDSNFMHLSSKQLHHVRTINLIGNEFTFKAVESLATINLDALQELFLNHNNIGRKGCKMLSKVKCPLLKLVCLESCLIDEWGTSHLTKRSWRKLENISLNQNVINRGGVKNLVKIHFPLIKTIQLSYNVFPVESAIILTELECQIQSIGLRGFEAQELTLTVCVESLLRKGIDFR